MTQNFTPGGLQFGGLSIAVIGAANLDISAGSSMALRPGDSTPGRITTTAGGVARNIAENLSRLGNASCLISAVGDDLQGRYLLDLTRGAGVDISMCRMWPDQRSSAYLSINNPDTSVLAAINDMAILELLTPDELMHHAASLARARAWVVDCNLNEASFSWLMQHRKNAPIFVDGVSSHKCTKVLPWLSAIHTLKINRLEARALTGHQVENTAQAVAAAQNLCARGVKNVVVSMGSAGVCWCQRTSHASGDANGPLSGFSPALNVNAVNSNGAGDALMAGLVHGALAGWPLAQSVQFANACAALTMTSSSANHPDLSEASAKKILEQLTTG